MEFDVVNLRRENRPTRWSCFATPVKVVNVVKVARSTARFWTDGGAGEGASCGLYSTASECGECSERWGAWARFVLHGLDCLIRSVRGGFLPVNVGVFPIYLREIRDFLDRAGLLLLFAVKVARATFTGIGSTSTAEARSALAWPIKCGSVAPGEAARAESLNKQSEGRGTSGSTTQFAKARGWRATFTPSPRGTRLYAISHTEGGVAHG